MNVKKIIIPLAISIAVLLIVLRSSGILVSLFQEKSGIETIPGGGAEHFGERWDRLVDKNLNIELEYPASLTAERRSFNSYRFKTNELVRVESIALYRKVGSGEYFNCSERGESQSAMVGDPNLTLEIRKQNFEAYIASERGYEKLQEWIDSGGQVRNFIDGRKYYIERVGVEMCDSSYVYIPIDGDRLVVIMEPNFVPTPGNPNISELRGDLPPFTEEERVDIFASIHTLSD